jgi:TolB protein
MDMNQASQTTQTGPSAAPTLLIARGNAKGKTLRLKPTTRIGREQDNDVILTDPRISRHHATIKLAEGRWVIQDEDSANGTFVNNKQVTLAHTLKPDDRIQLGDSWLIFQPSRVGAEIGTDTLAMAPTPARKAKAAAGAPQWRWTWLAGGLAILLIIIVVAVALLNRPAPTVADVTPTTSGGSTEALPEGFILVYEDDFSNISSGWDDAFDRYTIKQYGNNRYYIEVTTSNLVAWGLANRDIGNFRLQVDATQESGPNNNGYGVLFRFQDRDNYYRFDISGEGFYLLSKFYQGEWTTLVPWTASPAISVGQSTNVLAVEAIGPRIRIFANDTLLAEATDDTLTHGNFGFFANTFTESNLVVSFDDIKVWAPRGEALAVIPTSTPTRFAPTAEPPPAAEEAIEVEATPALSDSMGTPTSTEMAAPEPEPEATTAPTVAAPESPIPTPTVPVTPAPALPEYVSRDSPLARDAIDLGGRFYVPVFDSERATYDIYSLEPDGGSPQVVVEEASQPTVNETGERIAFRSWTSDNRGLIERGVSETDEWRFDPHFEAARPKFAPNGQSFLFQSRESGDKPGVYRTEGEDYAVLRRDGAPIQGNSPAWATDNTFVYQGCLGNNCGLIVSNLDGSFPVQITQDPSDTNPSVSPDGAQVAFMSQRSGNWEIFKVGIDGAGLTQLTNDEGRDGLPLWLPDGDLIAFVTDRDGIWEMWAIEADSGEKQFLFELPGSIDGKVAVDVQNARGWLEESIAWGP